MPSSNIFRSRLEISANEIVWLIRQLTVQLNFIESFKRSEKNEKNPNLALVENVGISST